MKVWDLMTTIDEDSAKAKRFSDLEDDEFPDNCPGDKLKKFSDDPKVFVDLCHVKSDFIKNSISWSLIFSK